MRSDMMIIEGLGTDPCLQCSVLGMHSICDRHLSYGLSKGRSSTVTASLRLPYPTTSLASFHGPDYYVL